MAGRKKSILFLLYLVVLSVPMAELALRIIGHQPFNRIEYSISSKPINYLLPSDSLGIVLSPGQFTVTMNDSLVYAATHSKKGLRTGHSNNTNKNKIAIFGCSYTYGLGINDQEVVSAQLNAMNHKMSFYNYAVPGYGTVQGFYQLKALIENHNAPDLAIFTFASFHVERNVMAPNYRKHLKIGYARAEPKQQVKMNAASFPYITIHNGNLAYKKVKWPEMYQNYWGREKSVLIDYLQSNIDKGKNNALRPQTSTLLLFEAIHELCEKHQIGLLVAGIDQHPITKEILDQLQQRQINTLDLMLPLENKEFNNAPYDTHPNKHAHQIYAQKINTAVKKYLN